MVSDVSASPGVVISRRPGVRAALDPFSVFMGQKEEWAAPYVSDSS